MNNLSRTTVAATALVALLTPTPTMPCRIWSTTSRIDLPIVCPASGKQDATVNGGGASCGRCGCDLPAVREVLRAAVVLLVQARSAMTKGAWDAALACATRSWALALRPRARAWHFWRQRR